jgi:hypothetical protein
MSEIETSFIRATKPFQIIFFFNNLSSSKRKSSTFAKKIEKVKLFCFKTSIIIFCAITCISINDSLSQINTFEDNDNFFVEATSHHISNTIPCQKNTHRNKCYGCYFSYQENSEKSTFIKIMDLFFNINPSFTNKTIPVIQFRPPLNCFSFNKISHKPLFEVLRT